MLATGDSDFGPVFRRLRELGKGVVGVGPSSVLSSSVALSCHEFIFTDENTSSGGSSKKRGSRKGGHFAGASVQVTGGAGPGIVSTRVATPPQLLSARGGFRIKHQGAPSVASAGAITASKSILSNAPDRTGGDSVVNSPLLLGQASSSVAAEVSKAKARVDWSTIGSQASPVSTPSPVPLPPPPTQLLASPLKLTTTGAVEHGEGRVQSPILAPGQLLLPEMVTSTPTLAVAPSPPPPPPRIFAATPLRRAINMTSASASVTEPAGAAVRAKGASQMKIVGKSQSGVQHVSRRVGGNPGTGAATAAVSFGSGLGALSVVRPSEKLYRHLLSLDANAESGTTGSLATDWGNGLSEVTVARGLVSLAEACGGQSSEHSWATETLGGFVAHSNHQTGGDEDREDGGRSGSGTAGLGRDEAYRVGRLLQRCGFLSWVAEDQQWLVTVPADVNVLRRRRDEAMMEELLTRCREAGVPFEPALATNLRWAKE